MLDQEPLKKKKVTEDSGTRSQAKRRSHFADCPLLVRHRRAPNKQRILNVFDGVSEQTEVHQGERQKYPAGILI